MKEKDPDALDLIYSIWHCLRCQALNYMINRKVKSCEGEGVQGLFSKDGKYFIIKVIPVKEIDIDPNFYDVV